MWLVTQGGSLSEGGTLIMLPKRWRRLLALNTLLTPAVLGLANRTCNSSGYMLPLYGHQKNATITLSVCTAVSQAPIAAPVAMSFTFHE